MLRLPPLLVSAGRAAMPAIALVFAAGTACSQKAQPSEAPAPPVKVAATAPVAAPAVAPAPAKAAQPAALPAAAPNAPAGDQPTWRRGEIARLAWGQGAQALGRFQGSEQNPTAPMAIAADGQGGLWVLDQLNTRVVRLDAATQRLVGDVQVPVAAAQDLALVEAPGPDAPSAIPAVVRSLLVLDRLVDGVVVALDPVSGREQFRLDLRGDGQPVRDPAASPGPTGIAFGGGVTGLFVHDGAIFAEWAHVACHRLGAFDGSRSGLGQTLAARPGHDGASAYGLERVGDHVVVRVHDLRQSGASAPRLQAGVRFPAPVFAVRSLDGAADGGAWMAVNTLLEDDAGAIVREGLEVVRLGPDGSVQYRDGALLEQGPHEQMRTFSLGRDGSYWHLARRDEGVIIERWTR